MIICNTYKCLYYLHVNLSKIMHFIKILANSFHYYPRIKNCPKNKQVASEKSKESKNKQDRSNAPIPKNRISTFHIYKNNSNTFLDSLKPVTWSRLCLWAWQLGDKEKIRDDALFDTSGGFVPRPKADTKLFLLF